MLAEALCKLEGFVYGPSDTISWQHGHSTERDFVYVTTQDLSPDQLFGESDDPQITQMTQMKRKQKERRNNDAAN